MAKQGPERGHFSRSRDLEQFNSKFGECILEKTIEEAMKKRGAVRVLEIGCGEGRILMQLRKLFPDIELHGINLKPWRAMRGQRSLKATGTGYKIFTRTEISSITLPEIHFYDVSDGLGFKPNHFDVVYSQVAIQYVKDKAKLLEEVWRVLKRHGRAFLHTDSRYGAMPDFMDNHSTPRFIIHGSKGTYPLKNLVAAVRKEGFDIRYSEGSSVNDEGVRTRRYMIRMCKSKPGLKLGLTLDELSSFSICNINREKKETGIYWGYRSVYNI
jgi:ubiquinone/menaquinone biosynthesis C-methylase UbiE